MLKNRKDKTIFNDQKSIRKLLIATVFKKLLAFTCLSASLGANAAYVVESAPGIATGIGGLEIGGNSYNVDFEAIGDSYSTFGGNEHFWEDETSARAAVNAITTFLTSKGIFALNNGTESTLGFEGFGVLFPLNSAAFSSQQGSPGAWGAIQIGDQSSAEYAATAWSVVPIPAAAWLFGSALLGLGVVKRKKA